MKKAFTLLELIFIIIIVAIITTIMLPDSRSTKLSEAATQLVSHIRYTQHLAMIDDRFDISDSTWFQEMWQIRFTGGSSASSDYKVAYGIFSDIDKNQAPTVGGNVALDPISGKYITGGVTNAIKYNHSKSLREANLGIAYGVTGINFNSNCQFNGSMRIAFDHLGRPIRGDLGSPTNSNTYAGDGTANSGALKLLPGTCEITLSNGVDNNITIEIEPETGYTHIKK